MLAPELANPFFRLSPAAARRAQFGIAARALLVNGLVAGIGYLVWPALLLLWPLAAGLTLTVVAPFFDVPSLVRRGKLVYYSPFLLAEPPSGGRMKLHGGTLFDYYFTLDRRQPSALRTRFVLAGYLRGLMTLLETQPDELVVEGTSYIVGPRTAARLGFTRRPTRAGQYIILLFNVLNLSCSLRLLRGRWKLADLRRVRTYEASVGALRARQDLLRALLGRLEGNAEE